MFRLTLLLLAVVLTFSVALNEASPHDHHHHHNHGPAFLRQARQVQPNNQNQTTGAPPTRGNGDRSIYARKATAVDGVISDVYEVYIRQDNFTYAKSAIVVLNEDGGSGVKGVIYLTQEGNHAPVKINGTITGLTPGKHGFHVHQSGNTEAGCKSTQGHFNPFMQPHGAPGDDKRHIGDLGNILADKDGVAKIEIQDSKLSLTGTSTIVGRSVVVHAMEDDLGKGGDEGSMKTGNAGGRVSCGVIAVN